MQPSSHDAKLSALLFLLSPARPCRQEFGTTSDFLAAAAAVGHSNDALWGCTSIVAQNSNGSIVHARNQDYSMPGLDNITITVDFTRGGEVRARACQRVHAPRPPVIDGLNNLYVQ